MKGRVSGVMGGADDVEVAAEDHDLARPCAACGALAKIVSEYDLLCRELLGALERRSRRVASVELATIPKSALEVEIDVYEDTGGGGASSGESGSVRRLVVLDDSPEALFRLEPLPRRRRRALRPARSRQR